MNRRHLTAVAAVLALLSVARCATTGPVETQAQAAARCVEIADDSDSLKALLPDDPAVVAHHVDLAALPAGYSHLPDGEGVLVRDGCAFVERIAPQD